MARTKGCCGLSHPGAVDVGTCHLLPPWRAPWPPWNCWLFIVMYDLLNWIAPSPPAEVQEPELDYPSSVPLVTVLVQATGYLCRHHLAPCQLLPPGPRSADPTTFDPSSTPPSLASSGRMTLAQLSAQRGGARLWVVWKRLPPTRVDHATSCEPHFIEANPSNTMSFVG